MGKTYRKPKTESHQRKINYSKQKGRNVNNYEDLDDPIFEICPEASGDDGCENSEDSQKDSR